jgi:hypothetical protein
MRVIKSIETTDAILTYSNITEDEYPDWGDDTSYNIGDQVIYQHKIYSRIVAGITATPPNLDQTNWLDLGATNKYRMFDNVISSVSSRTGGIQFELTPSQIVNGIALLNVNATTVRVVMTDPVEGVVYDQTKELRSSNEVVDYYTYFFAPIVAISDLNTAIFLDLPNKPTATIMVYVSSGASLVEVGEVVYGIQSVVGRTNYNTSFGLKSFSRKDIDEFGKVTVVKRKNSKYCEYDIDIDNVNLSFVQRLFQDIDSVPCLFIGNPDIEPLIVYGFYNDFKSTISFPTVSKCTLRVEGLV